MAKAQQLGVKATTGNTAANECDELRLLFREPTAVTHGHDAMDAACGILSDPGLALQLPFLWASESIGNHDSKIMDACGVG